MIPDVGEEGSGSRIQDWIDTLTSVTTDVHAEEGPPGDTLSSNMESDHTDSSHSLPHAEISTLSSSDRSPFD